MTDVLLTSTPAKPVVLVDSSGNAITNANPLPTSGGGGGGGGAVTIADGADVTQGAVADAAYSGSGNGTVIALLKKVVAELSAALSVTGTVTANAGTNLNTSALALETGGHLASADSHLASIDGHTPVLGQTTMAGSSPVVIASDQSNVPANIKQVNGSTLSLGQTTMSASMPVALASDQSNVPGNIKQVNGSTLSLGQTTMSASVPTTIASDQSNLPTNLKQVNGSTIATGNNAVPVLLSAATGYVAAFGSNPAALTSGTDYQFKWGAGGTTQVNHIMIQNNSSISIQWDLDTTANAGSPVLGNTAPGNTIFLDVQTSILHLLGTGTPNVNGSSANNIVVRGWL